MVFARVVAVSFGRDSAPIARECVMMFKPRMVGVVAMGLAAVVVLGGCKSWRLRRAAAAGGPGGAGVVVDPSFVGEDLTMGGERFDGGEVDVRFEPVYFEYDSSQVGASERAKIEAVADYLRRDPRMRVIVEGHCDERGSAEYNLALGERRALAARSYLVGLGIDANRVQTVSYGEERPAQPGADESAWRLNRRGEFVIVQ